MPSTKPDEPPPPPPPMLLLPLTATPVIHQHSCLALSSKLISFLADSITTRYCGGRRSEREGVNRRRLDQCEQKKATTETVVVLSIGSGTGLLEALLARELDDRARETGLVQEDGGGADADAVGGDEGEEVGRRGVVGGMMRMAGVFGVEVPGLAEGGMNRYLERGRRVVVRGVWDVLGREGMAGLLKRGADGEGEGGVKGWAECEVQKGEDGELVQVGVVDVWLMFVYPRQASLMERYLDEWLGEVAVRGLKLAGVIWAGPRVDWKDYEPVITYLERHGWAVTETWGSEAGVGDGEGVVVAPRR
jgi:hypothetical protein